MERVAPKVDIAAGRRTTGKGRQHLISLLPAIIFFAIFFVYPLTRMIGLSFTAPEGVFHYYAKIFESPVYARVLGMTFQTALGVTLICVALAIPTSYYMAKLRGPMAGILILAVVLPFFTSILIRTYAWMAILGQEGVVNQLLIYMGLISKPLRLMHNTFGVYVGMVHVLLPFTILPTYSVMRGIDPTLAPAAQSLGASPRKAFFSVLLPLSLPGIASGALLVFLIAIGFYITPALLGGLRDIMISNLIELQVVELLNWGFASALAVFLLTTTMVVMVIYNRFWGLDRMTVT